MDEQDKNIFKYEMNSKARYADPLVVERRVLKAVGQDDLPTIAKNAFIEPREGEKLSRPALELRETNQERLLKIGYAAFGVHPLNEETGEGVTETEVFTAFLAFLTWREEQKKSTETSQSLPEPIPDTSAPSVPTESVTT